MEVDHNLIEKIPPQNLEAEVSVLGAMLFSADALLAAIELLKEHYFYSEVHQHIFSAMVNLFERSQPIDLITVTEELRKMKRLEQIGGASYLAGLTASVATAANVDQHAKIVKEKALLRGLIGAATKIVEEGFDPSCEGLHALEHAEQMIFEINQDRIEGKFTRVGEIIKDSIEAIDQLYQRKEHVTGLATGFHEFDIKTAGLQPADLIIVAGRPSMGKSAFASGVVEHVSVILGKPVAFFSLEMSKEQLVQRLLCSHARVDAQKVRTGYLSHSDWPKLTNAAGKLSDAPIFIDDTPALSVLDIRAKARRLKMQHGIELVVIDYMQLMEAGSRAENRQQEISQISRSLKALARELHVPVIAISQLSRAVESRMGNRPQLSDLRESGSIEQDADVVTFLFREEYYNPTEENRNRAEAIISKQRNGPIGACNLLFIKEWTRFENPEFHRESSEEL
ncbi:MAG: replicative DNA helicase [Omnitrophica bacterium RIFCSPLOWO2_12_FULL_44_17]|uniref:Replicative DNA helicase n=1 Tax=Candidatus Danuiimicrobium aquiferis TaxID=1801832 RepID=A0A1G1KSY1_9BACT|nr:MAG: replicative DNA helicase [Omnitrophica bacterium RIFCSPHIGHO2_02_FULL_45_28]OGW90128.1 MAG: replicative DNA helicase [Omnitrophica bacterium RIFCSPHIGHO2_12_FULL_44_12]OGW95902.1 MAG: replicative DNA helicase [Omnitrophica bacterium RIFCSPLOWO2_12_FULL_44_17]OGX01901.1 MAG: replicative DNA helicase [Omnitrophica bacterium RIFCSPLOWO2_02_FULL_44_11]